MAHENLDDLLRADAHPERGVGLPSLLVTLVVHVAALRLVCERLEQRMAKLEARQP